MGRQRKKQKPHHHHTNKKNHGNNKEVATMDHQSVLGGVAATVGARSPSDGKQCRSFELESMETSSSQNGYYQRYLGDLARRLAFVFSQSGKRNSPSRSDVGLRGRHDHHLDESRLEKHATLSENETVSPTKVLPEFATRVGDTGAVQTLLRMAGPNPRQKRSNGSPNDLSDNDCSHENRTRSQASSQQECDDDEETWMAWSTHHSKIRGRNETTTLFLATFRSLIQQVGLEWNDFWHARVASQWGGLFRIAYAVLTMINWGLVLLLDFDLIFHQWLPFDVARPNMNSNLKYNCVLDVIPQQYHLLCGWIWMAQLILLALGVAPRFHAVCNVVWTCAFQFRTWLIWSGADIVFRLLAFYLLFLPLHKYTIYDLFTNTKKQSKEKDAQQTTEQEEPVFYNNDLDTWPIWPFRLIQIQMSLIYLSTALSKAQGAKWKNGTALFYIVQVDDLYGKFFHPSFLFGYENSLQALTFASLALECLVPVLIWWPPLQPTMSSSSMSKSPLTATRPPYAMYLAIVFHIGIDLSMNLNLFHYIMILGWCSFLAQPLPCPLEATYLHEEIDEEETEGDDDDE